MIIPQTIIDVIKEMNDTTLNNFKLEVINNLPVPSEMKLDILNLIKEIKTSRGIE